MQIIRNEMSDEMKNILSGFNIFLTALWTELSRHFCTAVQAVCFAPVFLMTHAMGLMGKGNASSNSKKYIIENQLL